MTNQKTRTLVQIALVAALYVVVTLVFAPISFNVIQIRFAEMFNFLVLFNRKYIVAVTLGVLISNLMSPLGLVDVIVGGGSTLLILGIVYLVTKRIHSLLHKLWVTVVLVSLSMFTIALELVVLFDYPFWGTYAAILLGEAISMSIGAVLIYLINKKVNLTRILS
ncbi:QueT transporter family protein [Listeria sp. PSOL-1]|uniref:QueT transporter family protein n=1 Tax=Listeria sp. PSOL-1 TaxID=1844999 RepID=UPI001E39F8D9|nr:QueT transporter family protein [Listeria sp. PSOL-1]